MRNADIKRLEAELAEAKEEVRALKERNGKETKQINTFLTHPGVAQSKVI